MANDKRFVAKNGLDNNNLTITNVASPVNPNDVANRTFSVNASNLETGTVPTGRLTGSYNISITGNSATATALQTARTISLTGDVTGSVSFNGTADASITATIAANSVALGTDTTGNYAGSVEVSGNGLTITGAAGEGTNFVVNSNAVSTNTASTIVFRDSAGNFAAGTITANLSGNATSANTATSATTATTATTATNVNGGTASVTTLTASGASNLNGGLSTTTISATGNVTVGGNLIVNGTTTTVNSTVTTLDDPVITLGGDTPPVADDNKDRGVEFRWHDGTAARVGFFGFDDSTGFFTFIPVATNTNEVFTGALGVIDATRITGSAATLTTPRTISLSGDVTGSVSFNGSADVTIAATIAANSVALGTDTTGSYVAVGAVSGNGLTGSANAETATFTVTSNATAANTANTIVFRDASGNFSAGTITAALNGNATSANTATTATTATNQSGGSVNATTITYSGEGTTTSTSAFQVPVGSTAQRPAVGNGKIRYNTTIGSYEGYNTVSASWSALGGGAKGNGTDSIFYENGQTVNTSYTVVAGVNAMSAGPITIANGVTVTVAAGARWVVV